jgi:type IV pilus assembly protein PilA
MLARIRKAQEEEGFTLIELLVVIIIIGILAAIAIPVFLNQRKKGYDAQAKSDLRNLATLEETYLTDNGTYADTATLAGYSGYKLSSNVTNFTVVSGGGTATNYKLGVAAASGTVWCYDSGNGGLYKGTGAAPASAATGGVTATMCP